MNIFCAIEELSLWNSLVQVLPFLLKNRINCLYVIDFSKVIFSFSRFVYFLFGKKIKRFHFKNVEIKDQAGLLLRLRIPNCDLHDILATISVDPSFRDLSCLEKKDNLWMAFLAKSLGSFDPHDKGTFFKAALLVQVCHWYCAKSDFEKKGYLFLNPRPWGEVFEDYGREQNIEIVFARNIDNRQHPILFYFKALLLYVFKCQWFLRYRCWSGPLKALSKPRLAVEYYGYFNLDQPELYSDFSFWQQSQFDAKDVSVFFRLPGDPLDAPKWEQLKKHGFKAVALDPRASLIADVVPFNPKFPKNSIRKKSKELSTFNLSASNKRWVKERLFYYESSYDFWRATLKDQGVQIYLTWFKYAPLLYPITQAMQDIGGIVAVYQRALDVTPFIETQLDTDVYFGYSKLVGEVEKKVGSKIPYFVVTGYLGDHRFSLLKPQAQKVREQLLSNGARFILSFTDEGSSDDPRWYTDHAYIREDYDFLLEKLLQNKWLGLVIKPKVPRTLRRRLGPVTVFLDEALKTGRCFLYETGDLMGSYPPAVAALSADIAIHGHLSAPTAGFEAALAGVPTLLLDREGWHLSPLYQLGLGKVVFQNWESLWESCLSHWQSKSGNKALGNWSGLLEQLDPFRDGQATKRMGTFLTSLLDAFKQGYNRDEALAFAAKCYCDNWGTDKIISI